MAGLLAGAYVDPRDLSPASPVRDLARAFLQDQLDKGRSPRTISQYARHLDGLLDFLERDGGTVHVRDLDIRTLRAYSSQLTRRGQRRPHAAGRPISPATKNLHLITLRGMLKLATLIDLPVPAPEKVELAKAALPSPDARHLEADKLDRMLGALDVATDEGLRARALLELMCATGCRVSEVVALDRAKIELDPHARTPPDGIRVLDEITVLGKGNRHRRVFLSVRAREWVQKYLRSRRDRDPALFVTGRRKADGSYRMSVWTAQKTVADAAKRAGLPENVSPHWLRHAAITLWTTRMGLPAAQRLAGHRNVATTSRYLGGSDAELKELYQRRIDGRE